MIPHAASRAEAQTRAQRGHPHLGQHPAALNAMARTDGIVSVTADGRFGLAVHLCDLPSSCTLTALIVVRRGSGRRWAGHSGYGRLRHPKAAVNGVGGRYTLDGTSDGPSVPPAVKRQHGGQNHDSE